MLYRLYKWFENNNDILQVDSICLYFIVFQNKYKKLLMFKKKNAESSVFLIIVLL